MKGALEATTAKVGHVASARPTNLYDGGAEMIMTMMMMMVVLK